MLPVLISFAAATALAGDVTVMNWNLLNFPGSTGAGRAPHMRTVIAHVQPDLLVCEEVVATAGRDYFQVHVLDELEPGAWAAGAFHDGFDTDRAIFYRAALFEVVDHGWLDTEVRDIDWWQVRELDSGAQLRVFAVHLKASQGEEQARLAEAVILREFLATLPDDLPVFVTGDFNVYTASEPAYEHLLAPGAGQLHDPLDRPGSWHDNPAFADVHTQSTRTESFGGGATGGMDDRFDFLLVGDDFVDGVGPEIQAATYTAVGNDGEHFNESLVEGGNAEVPYEVAWAIYQASDHLPLSCRFSFPAGGTPVGDLPLACGELSAWPNPFNPAVSLRIDAPAGAAAELVVLDARGRAVARPWHGVVPADGQVVTWQAHGLPSGVYLARLATGGATLATTRLVLVE